MEIYVFGNSFSHGIEMMSEAKSLAELNLMYQSHLACHNSAWPSLLSDSLNGAHNHSLPSSGFFGNVSRCIAHFQENPDRKGSFYLIDASLQQHLFLESHDKQKAPIFFEKFSLQTKYVEALNADLVQFQIWNTAQMLNAIGARFLFFFSYNPFWFGQSLNTHNTAFEILYEKYALEFFRNRESLQPVEFNKQLRKFLLAETPLIATLETNEITMFAHPKGPSAHAKIAQKVSELLTCSI